MKKCTSCGKEIKENVKFCMHCGQDLSEAVKDVSEETAEADAAKAVVEKAPGAVAEITPEEKAEGKPRSKKKLTVIIAAAAAFVCVAVAGTFLALNFADNEAPVSKEGSENKSEAAQKEDTSAEESTVSETEAEVSEEESSVNENDAEASSDSEPEILLPEDFGLEDIEALIDEFNKTTDEERKEELRLILEAIFSQAAELPMNE